MLRAAAAPLTTRSTPTLSFAQRRLCAGRSALLSADSTEAASSTEGVSTLKLYRDCMRLTYHIAAQSAKGEAMRAMVRSSFKEHVHVTDPAEISKLKMRAMVGIQNYVIHDSTRHALPPRNPSRAGRRGVPSVLQESRQQAQAGQRELRVSSRVDFGRVLTALPSDDMDISLEVAARHTR